MVLRTISASFDDCGDFSYNFINFPQFGGAIGKLTLSPYSTMGDNLPKSGRSVWFGGKKDIGNGSMGRKCDIGPIPQV